MKKCLFILNILILFGLPLHADKQSQMRVDSLTQQIEKIYQLHGERANKLLGELKQIVDKSNVLAFYEQYLYWKTMINYAHGVNDTNLCRIIRLQLDKKGEKKEASSNNLCLLYAFALNSFLQTDHVHAFSSALQVFEQASKLHDTNFMVKSLMILGNTCRVVRNWNIAAQYFLEAQKLTSVGQYDYYRSRINLYNQRFLLSQNPLVYVDSLKNFIPALEKHADTSLLVTAYLNIGVYYVLLKNNEPALSSFQMAQALSHAIDNEHIRFTLNQNLGFFYLNKEVYDFEKSLYYLKTAQAIASKNDNKELLAYTLKNLSALYHTDKKVDSAFFYLSEYNTLRDELDNNAKIIDAYQAYVSTLLESSQSKLKITEQALQLRNKRFVITLILAIGFLVSGALLWIIFYQRKRQQMLVKEAENKDLTAQLEHEQHIKQLQSEQIEEKLREITSYSLLLSNKNNVLSQILELAKHEGNKFPGSKKINELIINNLNTDSEWETFMLHFEKVHPSFFSQLKSLSIYLTENDLRICSYTRIGMATKQIAQILNVTPLAIKMARYRIKKKLDLDPAESLDDFIRNI